MDGFLLRPACERDIPALTDIWSVSFGDSPELAAALIHDCGLFRHAAAAEKGGQAVGCMFAFDGLRFGGRHISYLYALCTAPEHRGLGIGSALVGYAASEAFRRGAEAVLLRPADAALSRWYETLGFTPLCFAETVPLPTAVPHTGDVRELSAAEYLSRRCSALYVTEELLQAQETLFRFGGGGFLEADGCCLCAELDGSGLLIRDADRSGPELVRAGSAAAAHFGAKRVLLRRRTAASGGDDILSVMTRDGSPFPDDGELFLPFTLE